MNFNNKEISGLTLDGKEVKTIESDGEIWYNSVETPVIITQPLSVEFKFIGGGYSFHNQSKGFVGTDMVIDWGDGHLEYLSSNTKLPDHKYNDNQTEHIVKVYGATEFGEECLRTSGNINEINIYDSITTLGSHCLAGFAGNIQSITLPNSLTTIGDRVFEGARWESITIPASVTSIGVGLVEYSESITRIIFEHRENPVQYNSNTYRNIWSSGFKFSIPYGTTSIYESAGYPSSKLIERSE